MRFVALALALGLVAPVQAQAPTPPPTAVPQPPAEAPAQRGPRQQQQQPQQEQVAPGPGPQERGRLDTAEVRGGLLDQLFQKLREAASREEAQPLDEAISAIWARSGSPTADLLMAWATEEILRRNTGRALDYLDGLLILEPDFAEAYHRRAQIHFAARDYARAMADLERVLVLEPRHYGALVGVGMLMRDLGRHRQALGAFRAALAVHPQLESARRAADLLAQRVDGRDG